MVIAKMWYYSDLYKEFGLIAHDMVINKGALYSINKVHIEWLNTRLSQRSQKMIVTSGLYQTVLLLGASVEFGKEFYCVQKSHLFRKLIQSR